MKSIIQRFKVPGVHKFLDERNKDLWKRVNRQYAVAVRYSNNESYLCYTEGNKSIIYVPKSAVCIDSFTHELLHVYLKAKRLFIGRDLLLQFKQDEVLANVYTEELLQQIGNCLDHYKMLPLYLNLGFDRVKFITDYSTPKCTDAEVSLIRMFINDNAFKKQAADLYLGKFFCMKTCPDHTIDYSKFFGQLEAIDKDLYNILNRFWISFDSFDMEKQDRVFNNYNDFCTLFVLELKRWTANKLK